MILMVFKRRMFSVKLGITELLLMKTKISINQ